MKRSPRPARLIPVLEVLEDRLVPSTLTVTNNSDTGVAGDGSLRGEIAAASAGDTIVFANGLAGQTITLTHGELSLSANLTIQGLGAGQLAVSGNHAGRVFNVGAGATVQVSGLTIENGQVTGSGPGFDGQGGGVYNAGDLTLTDCTLSANQATGVAGPNGGGAGSNGQGGALYAATA